MKPDKTDNELIAEFMGQNYPQSQTGQVVKPIEYIPYATSWDWLITCIEKIENIKDSDGTYKYCFDIGRDWCIIRTNGFEYRVLAVGSICSDKIKSTHTAVINFIKWYNSNNTKL